MGKKRDALRNSNKRDSEARREEKRRRTRAERMTGRKKNTVIQRLFKD
jgi:hypothetical protein